MIASHLGTSGDSWKVRYLLNNAALDISSKSRDGEGNLQLREVSGVSSVTSTLINGNLPQDSELSSLDSGVHADQRRMRLLNKRDTGQGVSETGLHKPNNFENERKGALRVHQSAATPQNLNQHQTSPASNTSSLTSL